MPSNLLRQKSSPAKQKHHHPPDYPGNLEQIARRIGKRLVEEFRKLKERRHD